MIKNVIAVVILLIIVVPANNYAAPALEAPAASHKHVSPGIKDTEVNHADIRLDKPKNGVKKKEKPEPSQKPPKNEPLSFRTVNGVSVDSSKEQLLGDKGMPIDMRRDKLLGTIELSYKDVTVGWYDGGVDYLIVPASEKFIVLSGTRLLMTYTALRLALGKPDYEAEDGIVYERDGLCLKLFLKPGEEAPQLESVQLYWSASV